MVNIILAARGRITTHFQEDIGRGFLHRGVDQGHGDGNAIDLEIKAPADGTVTFAGPFGSYGNVLYITHDDGWLSVLAHHKTQLVGKGARVRQGQVVAVMGNTGTVYVHNHQELRDAAGNQVDPLLHLVSATSAASNTTPLELEMTPEQNRMLTAVYDAIFNGGGSMADGGRSISASLGGIVKVVDQIRATTAQPVLRDTNGDGVNEKISQIQDNADTNTMVRRLLAAATETPTV